MTSRNMHMPYVSCHDCDTCCSCENDSTHPSNNEYEKCRQSPKNL